MRRLIIFLLILLTFTGQISADSLSSSSVSSGASIPMILKKPASAEGSVNVGFSKTSGTITTITGTQYLTLSKGYLTDPSSTITASGTYYAYWVVNSYQYKVDINLSWYLQKKGPSDTEASDVSTSDSIFDVTVKNSSGTEYTDKTTVDNTTRIKLSTVRSYNSENEYAEIGIKTKDGTDLGNEEYGTVYTLTFTLKVENS